MSIPNESNINARRLKSISTPADLNKRFFQVNSEPVAQFMVEKLISLAITNSHHAKIIREIPNYCFDKLKETIKVKAMEMKKKLKAQQEIMEKIKEKQNKQKELEYKNVTVDVNGNLVQIKPISLESLANEFTNPNTK